MRLRNDVEVQVQEENRWQGLAILYQKLKLRLVVCLLQHNSNGSHEGALHAHHAWQSLGEELDFSLDRHRKAMMPMNKKASETQCWRRMRLTYEPKRL